VLDPERLCRYPPLRHYLHSRTSRRYYLERAGVRRHRVFRGAFPMRPDAPHSSEFLRPPDEWATLLPVAETVPTLELIGISFIEGEDRLLPPNSALPRLKVLSIVVYEFGRIFDQFLEIPDAQPTLHCAHLRITYQDRRPTAW
jgi:hypothetical protein